VGSLAEVDGRDHGGADGGSQLRTSFRLLQDIGVRTAKPYGIVEITP
jgi:hypothetical protein